MQHAFEKWEMLTKFCSHWRPYQKCGRNGKIDLKEMRCEAVNWIHLVLYETWNFNTIWVTVSFPGWNLLHGALLMEKVRSCVRLCKVNRVLQRNNAYLILMQWWSSLEVGRSAPVKSVHLRQQYMNVPRTIKYGVLHIHTIQFPFALLKFIFSQMVFRVTPGFARSENKGSTRKFH
jgi:hypothetical protein